MATCEWSPEAELDLEEIAFHIGVTDGRPSTAAKIVRECHDLCELIASHPFMGEAMSYLAEGLRGSSFKGRWLVLYRPAEQGIQVVRVLEGSRDFLTLF